MSYRPVSQWSQKIACCPNHGREYIERFFAGEVPDGDVPDQPTLKYIRRIMKEGFNANEFESLYLDSQKKLTGPLNKIVQFAGLIPRRLAYEICDTIFYWISKPEHAKCCPEPERFIISVIPDVFEIIDYTDMRRRKHRVYDGIDIADERAKWLTKVVQLHTRKAPLLAVAIVESAIEKGYKGADKLPDVLLEHFEGGFLKEERPLLPSVSISRFALAWLMDVISEYPGYRNIRESFTQKIIAEAENESGTDLKERIIFSLVATTTSARSGEIRPEEHQFSVEKGKNEQKYDMSSITDALKKWYTVKWSDEIAKRAFSRLKQEYNIN